jgi:amino-acid N-acetyltransferase
MLSLLDAAGLPREGVAEHLHAFVLALRDGALIGCAGMELYGTDGLLRSVAVAEPARGQGIAQALVQQLVQRAAVEGVETVTLLTTTASGFFPRFGFRVVARSEVPVRIHTSVEFQSACPASATAMLLDLRPARSS